MKEIKKQNNVLFIIAFISSIISMLLLISFAIVLYSTIVTNSNASKPPEVNLEVTTPNGKFIKLDLPSEYFKNSYDVIKLNYPLGMSGVIVTKNRTSKIITLILNQTEITVKNWDYTDIETNKDKYKLSNFSEAKMIGNDTSYYRVLEKDDPLYNYYFIGEDTGYGSTSYRNNYNIYTWSFKVPKTIDPSFIDNLMINSEYLHKYELIFKGDNTKIEDYLKFDFDQDYYFFNVISSDAKNNICNKDNYCHSVVINKNQIPENILLTTKEEGQKYIAEGYIDEWMSEYSASQKIYAITYFAKK